MIDKNDILRVTGNGLDVFRHYVPGNWVVKKPFLNPFYNDTNPSCYIYSSKGKYIMHDHGNDYYSGDCFDIVEKILGYVGQFDKVVETINRDMSLGLEGGEMRVQRSTPKFRSVSPATTPKANKKTRKQVSKFPYHIDRWQ